VSKQALETAIGAATRVNIIVAAYRSKFSLKTATPFICYDILSAGTIWVAALTINPDNEEHAQRLQSCIQWLDELQGVWTCAKQSHQLLKGAAVAQLEHPKPLQNLSQSQPQSSSGTSSIPNYPMPNYALPPQDHSFSNLMDGSTDFGSLMNESWDSPFDLLMQPNDSHLDVPGPSGSGAPPAPGTLNPLLTNPYHSHLGIFAGMPMDGVNGFGPPTNGVSGSGSNSQSQTDSNSHSHSASTEPPGQAYM